MAILGELVKTVQEEKYADVAAIMRALGRGVLSWNTRRGMMDYDVIPRDKSPRHDFFYISDLGYCPRMVFLRQEEKPEVAFLLKCIVGDVCETKTIELLQRGKILYGLGLCRKCAKEFEGVIPPKCKCGGVIRYCPIGIRNSFHSLAGRIDFFISLGDRFVLVESKTASTYYKLAVREKVVEFFPQHHCQANMYLGQIRRFLRLRTKGKDTTEFTFYNVSTGENLGHEGMERFFGKMELGRYCLLYEDKNASSYHPHLFDYSASKLKENLSDVRKYRVAAELEKYPEARPNPKVCKWCGSKEECYKIGQS